MYLHVKCILKSPLPLVELTSSGDQVTKVKEKLLTETEVNNCIRLQVISYLILM